MRGEERIGVGVFERHTDSVADAHLEQRLRRATVTRRRHGKGRTFADKALDRGNRRKFVLGSRRHIIGVIAARSDERNPMASALELRTRHAIDLADRSGEGHERRGNIEVLERFPTWSLFLRSVPSPRSSCA